MTNEDRTWVLLALFNLPVYLLLGKTFFGNWAGFGEAVVMALRDSWRVFGSDYNEGLAASMLWVFVILCAGIVYAEHWILVRQMGLLLP